MELSALAVFVAALFIAAASPGPGMAAVVARMLGRGARRAIAFTAGVALGDLVWLTLAILGLAVLAQTFHLVFLTIKYAGVAYLLYLACCGALRSIHWSRRYLRATRTMSDCFSPGSRSPSAI